MTINLSDKIGRNNLPPNFGSLVPFKDYTSGLYYHGGSSISNRSNVAMTADTIYYLPFGCLKTHTFTGIGIYNGSAAQSGAKLRLGLYANGNNLPDSLILDAGEVTLDASTAYRVITISQQLQKNTLYWLAFVSDTGTNVSRFNFDISGTPRNVTAALGHDPNKTESYLLYDATSESFTYATLPATATPTTGVTASPAIFLKG